MALVATIAGLFALPAPAGAVLSGWNGRILFTSGRGGLPNVDTESKLYLRTIDGSTGGGTTGPTITPVVGTQHRHGTWSPDRTKIAYARGTPGSPATEDFDIYIQDLTTGAAPVPITNTGDNVTSDRPAWSPDGTRIAFENEVNNNTGERNIEVYTVAGGGTIDLTATAAPNEGKPAWSPDSSQIYYASGDTSVANAVDILRQPSGGGAVAGILTDNTISEFQPSVSPDGSKLCYTRGTAFNSTAEVYVTTSAPGSSAGFNLSDDGVSGDYNCTWSPDGRFVAYVNGIFTSGGLVMEAADDSGFPLPLEDVLQHFDGNPDWAPDGTPTCEATAANVGFNASVSIPLSCTDTGPAYEQTSVTESVSQQPANGNLSAVQQGNPSTVIYTPNLNFSGMDTFKFHGFDARQFASSVTVTVIVAGPGGGGGGGAGNKSKTRTAFFTIVRR